MRVLQIVSDDVGLLQEQAHGVGQLGVPPHLGVLQLGRGEQLRQADADQPRHVVTILHRRRERGVSFDKIPAYDWTRAVTVMLYCPFTRSHSFMDPTFFSRNSAIPTPIRWQISEMTSLYSCARFLNSTDIWILKVHMKIMVTDL